MRAYLALIKIYIKLAMREKVVLFFNYILPLGFLFIFGQLMGARSGGATQVVTMVLVIGILGNGLFGAGIRAVVERETNVLRRYKVAPITPLPILTASMVSGWVLYLPTFVLILLLTHFLYGMPVPASLFALFVLVSLGNIALRSIGLIVAAVVNSAAESNIIVQLLYMPMLFLSGATIPMSVFPLWLQKVAQFLPATYVYSGLQGTMLRNESLPQNAVAALALLAVTAVGTFVSMKLFRWEKEEKLPARAKLWIVVVFMPFLALGAWQVHSEENIARNREYERTMRRNRAQLIRGPRIVIGDGTIVEHAAVLIAGGKIQRVFRGSAPDAMTLNAEPVDAFGKTLLPGLIELDPEFSRSVMPARRALAAYLYCGVTAVASRPSREVAEMLTHLRSGEWAGPEIFLNPTLSARRQEIPADAAILSNFLVQQVVPAEVIEKLRKQPEKLGSIPGFRTHRRLHAEAEARHDNAAVIAAFTSGAAREVQAGDRLGQVKAGYEASFVIVDGNPIEDIAATDRISDVFFKGEHIDRSEILKRRIE